MTLRHGGFQEVEGLAEGARVDAEYTPRRGIHSRKGIRAVTNSDSPRGYVGRSEHSRRPAAKNGTRIRSLPRLRSGLNLGVGTSSHPCARPAKHQQSRLRVNHQPTGRREKNAPRSHRKTHTVDQGQKTPCPVARATSEKATSGQRVAVSFVSTGQRVAVSFVFLLALSPPPV